MAVALLSTDQCKTWDRSGKSEFFKTCKHMMSGSHSLAEGTDEGDVKRALYELCWQTLNGALRVDQAVSALAELADLHADIPSVLADIFSVIDVETLCEDEKLQREKYMSLVPACTCFIPEAILKERLDLDTLESLGLIASKFQFQQKYVKTKTKLFYKQQKFNLLREENEGYAKLMTELNQDMQDVTDYKPSLENIKSLIGCFNLDPNRVLDILLESFECRPFLDNFFIALLQRYMSDRDTLCQVLGFKFHFYQTTQDSETPASLYQIAALLLHHKLIGLDHLYPHLSPSDTEIQDQYNKEMEDASAYARKVSVVVLSEKSAEDKDKDEKDAKSDLNQDNQKLGLIGALLEVGDWEHARNIMNRLPQFFAPTFQPVAGSLCRLISFTIDPMYEQNSGLPKSVMKHRHLPVKTYPPGCTQVKTWSELEQLAFPMLSYLGPHLAFDHVLMVKVIRLGKVFMAKYGDQKEQSEEMQAVFLGLLSLLDEVILPSLSLLPCNCCMSEEIWGLLRMLKYEYRYRLYGQWKNDSYSYHPRLIRAQADCIEKAKYIMKRLAKENVKPLGRQIGKLSHSNPGVLFEYVLSQIQRYDNFIGPVVDSLKFLTSLSYDMLAYCIIEALANPEKERLKHDDTNISMWLQSLASFSGAVFKKYQIELTGLIQYVINQLKAGKSYDLLILREVVQKMSGIEVSEEITEDQLEALSGGELLRQEGGYFAQVRNTKKSSSRLKDALLDHELAIPLCLQMAQQRDGIIFPKMDDEDTRHIKLVGKLYDQCQDTLVQFSTFLSTQLTMEEFSRKLPPIEDLVDVYHINADAAFALSRILYAHAVNAKYEELRKADKKDKSMSSTSHKQQRYVEAVEVCTSPIVERILPLYTPKIWEDLSPRFYITFWSLTMYDLHVPTAVYEKQVQQLKSQMNTVEENKDMAQSKKKKEKERCVALIDKLNEEEKKQQEHIQRVMARLKQEKESWFVSKTTKNMTITNFLQMCVFPRICFTAPDATFCAKFIHTLHNLKTPNFSTLICYDRIFCDISFTVTSCTENEAHRYGRFLCSALDTIMRWHGDRSLYEKECSNYPGFCTMFRKEKNPTKDSSKADQLDFENYRHVCHKWHHCMTKAFVVCLESASYIQIRNSLIVLTRILPNYPRVMRLGQALERRVDRITKEEREKRPDIYALAMGYSGMLKTRKKTWIAEQDFHDKDKDGQSRLRGVCALQAPKSTQVKVNGPGTSGATIRQETGAPTSKDTVKRQDSEKDGKDKARDLKEAERKVDTKVEVDSSKSETAAVKAGKTSSKVKSSDVKVTEKRDSLGRSSSKDKDKDKKDKSATNNKDKAQTSKEKSDNHKAQASKDKSDNHKGQSSKDKGDKDKGHGSKDKDKTKKDKEERAKKEEKEKEKHRDEKPPKEGRGHDRDRAHPEVKIKEEKEERSASVTSTTSSHGSGHRRSAEPSPKVSDERDVKRRKVEVPSSSTKDPAHTEVKQEKPHKSPGRSEKERPKEREREREHEREKEAKVERKRVSGAHSLTDDLESKRHKVEDSAPAKVTTSGTRVNGESDEVTPRPRSKSHDRHREKSRERERIKSPKWEEPSSSGANHVAPKSSRRETSPEVSTSKERKADRHSGSKKSKK